MADHEIGSGSALSEREVDVRGPVGPQVPDNQQVPRRIFYT